ncbi:MAG: hypothetical protein CMH57_07205 [Myxococcales bacterium]|nr:hypothetical protein [Myxococcales bacterium]
MTNIFLISDGLGPEDRFTTHLAYLLENIPELGQAWANLLLERSGRPTATYQRCVDHPPLSPSHEDLPDFMLDCGEVQIVCEHKLDAQLGPDQLERYLALETRGDQGYLALISSVLHPVADAVANHPDYLRPTDRDATHFSWSDLYPLVEARDERLAVEFSDYMRRLGMKPWRPPADWATLFDSAEAGEAFAAQWELVRAHFRPWAERCQKSAGGRGFEVRKPAPWLHLMYLCVVRPSRSSNIAADEPYLAARIYINSVEHTTEMNAVQREAEQELTFSHCVVRSHPMADPAPSSMSNDVKLSREFRTDLLPLLELEKPALRQELLNFAVGVFEHTSAVVESV